ncbi:hybrid sensor histidine kinase/response regulator [Cohnella hashimotonis]|uniref:histidine kinase n=1 Tax=Cohnella hashimotonis TaxID=2826895 RepID=A0ABT6TCI6_9BACL|nr:ATP-binding protein [Cohnella hashimotonis]MDI4643542.1 ATP-binding protein [Cohnella hashimotonis]
MIRKNALLLGMIGLFVIVTIVNVFQWLSPATQSEKASGGLLDATHWDFAKRGVLSLRGEWEFYEGELLRPEDFRAGRVEGRFVQVPGGWKNKLASANKKGYGAGTYRLLVRTDEAALYSMRAKKIRMSSHVFMNGVDMGGNGSPSLSADGFEASNAPFFGTVLAESGTVEIIIQIASFDYLEGGLVQPPEFGLADDAMKRRDDSRLADMIQTTILLAFGLYYAGMFRQWRREPHLMHFCLFCLSLGLFFSIDNEILALDFLPGLTFPWLQKMLFLLPLFSFYFFTYYVYRYLKERDNVVFTWLRRVSYAYLATIVLLPNRYLVSFLDVGIAIGAAAFGAMLYAVFRSRSRGNHSSHYITLGIFFLFVSWLYAHLRYQLALDNPYYMVVTPALLVLSQALLMSDELQLSYRRSERLSQRLLHYDRQKDEFLVKTSHELRTPLHGIVNLSQALLDNRTSPLQAEHRDNVHMLHLLGRRLAGLVHDILDLNRIRHGQLLIRTTSVNLGQSVRFVMETLSISPVNKEVRLVNALPAKLPLLLADENRVKQILYNLLENGLKFTKQGTVTLSAERRGDELAISVTDTGRGIPAHEIAGLFQTFVQSEEIGHAGEGLGLGLSIAKQLAELQGGRLEAESTVGVGSRFTFTLPIDPASEEAAAAAADEELSSSLAVPMQDNQPAEFHLLIVDDEPSNLKVLIDEVSSMGYGYTAVGSGEEALEALRRHKMKPDLLLLDLMMPGISGLDVCREIRLLQGLAELPILMMTASGQTGDIVASFAAGANDIVQKPFELAELRARVQSLLAMKSSSERAVRREMDLLQAQITPHFLYNSMNALVGLSYKNVEKLRETIHHLSTYLRAKFTFVFSEELVPFEREMELVKAYLAIEQLRFGSRLAVEIDIKADFRCMLPPLTLQPIVENAVRHGIGPKASGGTLRIAARRRDGGAEITVEDDGVGIGEELLRMLKEGRAAGVGVGNVNRRLQLVYGGGLDIRSGDGTGTLIKLQIPEARSSNG